MLKRYLLMLCILVPVGAADNPEGSPAGGICNCHTRVKLGYQNEKFPAATETIILHQNGEHEYFKINMSLVTNQAGSCSPYSCNTQEDCLYEQRVSWTARNFTGAEWTLDIGGPNGSTLTFTIPDETFNPGSLARMLRVTDCGGVDFITFNLTIDGITTHFPITIWCNPCEDSDSDY